MCRCSCRSHHSISRFGDVAKIGAKGKNYGCEYENTKMNGFGNFFPCRFYGESEWGEERFTLENDYSLLPIWIIPSLLATCGWTFE